MATVKFEGKSPYQSDYRGANHTDYKYLRYLETHKSADSELISVPEFFNVALFGVGRAGSIHLANIRANPKIRLQYVVDEDKAKLAQIQSDNELDALAVRTPEEADVIFSDAKIQGIIIATPTFTHEALVTKALLAGKAVLCEKPISQDEEGIKRCYEVSKETGVPLLCAFNRRFEPAIKELYRQVHSGKVGRVHIIKTVSRDSPLPPISYLKISGGIFHDCAVHDIDIICWILGEYPERVCAMATTFIPEIKALNDHDTVAITLKFPSGTIGTIDLSRNAVYGYDQRIEVFGPKGMVEAANERPFSVSYSSVAETCQPPILHSFPSRYEQGYFYELNHFCEIMQGKCEPIISAENTLKVSKIASALEESVRKGDFIDMKY